VKISIVDVERPISLLAGTDFFAVEVLMEEAEDQLRAPVSPTA
jgi:hypothetical protein